MRANLLLCLDPSLMEEARSWFKDTEIVLVEARDFDDSLKKLREKKAELFLVDFPSLRGLGDGAVARIRRACPEVYFVCLSDTPGVDSENCLPPSGIDAVKVYPLAPDDVNDLSQRAEERFREKRKDQEGGEIRELWEISKAIASGASTVSLLEKIIQSASRVTSADSGSIMLMNTESQSLIVAAATGPAADLRRGKEVALDSGIAGWVATKGEPLLLQGKITNDERFRHLVSRRRIRSSLCVPVKGKTKRLLGVLSLNMEESDLYFTQRDLKLMSIYAMEAGSIIESSRAFDALQSANLRLRNTNEKLKAIQAQLVQSSKMAAVGLLASGIAHEFNNLLTGILGMAQLARHTRKDKHVWKSIEVSELNSQKAKDIIKNLLKFSGRYKKVREKTEIPMLVEEVLSLMGRELEKEGIEVARNFAPRCIAPVNRSEIQQVILNLLINAKQAMEGPGRVDLAVSQTRDVVEISVCDTGCGISEENLPRIFEPFFSTKSLLSGGGDQGTGLGLSVSYGIVKSHGGEILVKSESGEGTTFRVRLPKSPRRTRTYTDSIPLLKEPSEVIPEGIGPIQINAETVVVIDDEWWIREFLRDTMDEMGYTPVLAEDGETGLNLIEEHKPALVFLDLVMPTGRGEEIAADILKRFPGVRVVLMTGKFETLESIEKNIERGIFAYLSKPFDVQDVYGVVTLARDGEQTSPELPS